MRKACLALVLTGAIAHVADALTFRAQGIATGLGIVYAVTVADVNGDGKPDIVAINQTQILWFENPTWTKHVVTERVTAHDNVAIAPYDINADGKLDFALGADWQATNTSSGGSLHWITQAGKVHEIAREPTIHRIRWIDVDGDGRSELVVVPLHGRGTTAPAWTNGPGSRILVFHVPAKPDQGPWPMEIADSSLHIVHNFIGVNGERTSRRPRLTTRSNSADLAAVGEPGVRELQEIWVASAEGVFALKRSAEGKWSKRPIAEGQPGEIKLGHVNGARCLATVEPWHGNSVVVYKEGTSPWSRTVIDTSLNQGHALGWADFDGDGEDELVAGWRGKPWGLVLYRFDQGAWKKTTIDEGVAVEDLAIADLNADGRPEVIAGGRATENIRIYWPSK